jgi:CBS-domain-containing membrane protein
MSLSEYLSEFTCEDIIKSKSNYKIVLVADSTSNVMKATSLLAEKKIHSMPVYDVKHQKVLGMIDYLDCVSYLVARFPEKNKDLNDVKLLDEALQNTMSANVVDVCNFSGRDPYQPLKFNEVATKVVPLFAAGFHRIPLLGEEGDLVMTISQSALINFLLPWIEKHEIGKKTVDQLNLGLVAPATIKEDDFILSGLLAIYDKNVNAVGVVSSNGSLIGNFSATDITSFNKDHLPTFTFEAKLWLETHAPKSLSPVTATSDCTFYDVCRQLTSGPNRVWIVDGDKKPTGVISQTNVFKVLATLLK